jgi:SAM-dependent methyltransferase
MLSTTQEYQRMFEVEEQLWWYRILHEKVLSALSQHFQTNKNIQILDAGCGTGGMLESLRKAGYNELSGFDISIDAVHFCRQRGFNITQQSIATDSLAESFHQKFDAIVCNDVFCYLDDTSLAQAISHLSKLLKPGGILMTNNNAFNHFYGLHDVMVGSKRRFVKADLENHFRDNNLIIKQMNYWPLLLALPIWAIRTWQRWQMKFKSPDFDTDSSDVKLPPLGTNGLLYWLIKWEEKLLPSFWGSSIWVVAQK